MPRKKHGNVKSSKTYEGLRKRGMNKTRAAKIANAGKKAQKKGGKNSAKSRRSSSSRSKKSR